MTIYKRIRNALKTFSTELELNLISQRIPKADGRRAIEH